MGHPSPLDAKRKRPKQFIKNFSLFIKQCYHIFEKKTQKNDAFSKCTVCDSKKSTFIEEHEASRLLST